MKVQLAKCKNIKNIGGIPWTACEPFVENSKAVLIHRVRHVTTHKISAKYKPHIAVHNWCGSGATGTKKFTFLSEPPVGKLLCARCEELAVRSGLQPASEIAGQHVHIGKTIAVRMCCAEKGGEA